MNSKRAPSDKRPRLGRGDLCSLSHRERVGVRGLPHGRAIRRHAPKRSRADERAVLEMLLPRIA